MILSRSVDNLARAFDIPKERMEEPELRKRFLVMVIERLIKTPSSK